MNVFIGPLRLLKNCCSDGGCFIDNESRTYFKWKQNTYISLCKFNDKLKCHGFQFAKQYLTLTPFFMWHVVYKTSFDWLYTYATVELNASWVRELRVCGTLINAFYVDPTAMHVVLLCRACQDESNDTIHSFYSKIELHGYRIKPTNSVVELICVIRLSRIKKENPDVRFVGGES